MKRFPSVGPLGVATVAIVLICAVELSAHGGQYRGFPPPPDNVGGGRGNGRANPPSSVPPGLPKPATPGPVRPGPAPGSGGPPGPATPGTPTSLPDASRWQLWWEMNKDQFLYLKPWVRRPVAVTGDDEFYMGSTRRRERHVDLAPDPRQVVDRIVPALYGALGDSNHPDLVTATLVGLAKIGRDHRGLRLLDVLRKHVRSSNLEIRETATLALGISRRAEALPLLRDLLLDNAVGRGLVDRARVGERVRAFAAYGLGIVIAHGDAATRRIGFEALRAVLDEPDLPRDVQVAAISAIGVMDLRPQDNSADKRLLWRALPALEKFYRGREGRFDFVARAHVPVAIGRLLGRGDSADHARYRDLFAAELAAGKAQPNEIVQSAVIALGLLASAEHRATGDLLHDYFTGGRDQQARYFSLIAMGEIGGTANRNRLLRVLSRGKKTLERPWAALALGVLTHRARQASGGVVDDTVGQALAEQLVAARNKSAAGAFAIGLGLCGSGAAMPQMRKLLGESQHDDEFAGFLCLGHALCGDREAIGVVREVMLRARRRPLLLRRSAIALGRLQDKHAAPQLLEMIEAAGRNTSRMAAVSGALQFIGDKRTVDALVARLDDEDHTRLARAFIAAALGGIADPMLLPFGARYAKSCNYRAVVPTLTNEATGILDLL